ncbi:MAG: hypothetical protein JO301_07200 [Chitinophagaceae bacterium]|nr:hypothetical protein [Chitinophagaceae bacterium]
MEEKQLTEQESLRLITDMINKARSSFHESGASAILWGSVVAIAGLTDFAQRFWNFRVGFDIWLVVLAAFIPQIIISIRESRRRKVVALEENAVDAIWMVYGISIFMLTFYLNVVPGVSERMLSDQGQELMVKNLSTGEVMHQPSFVISGYSLLLLLYAMPTLATGIARKFRPMLVAGILCYIYFLISCFTTTVYDLLLNGLAGITCWLIPGLILRNRYLKAKSV